MLGLVETLPMTLALALALALMGVRVLMEVLVSLHLVLVNQAPLLRHRVGVCHPLKPPTDHQEGEAPQEMQTLASNPILLVVSSNAQVQNSKVCLLLDQVLAWHRENQPYRAHYRKRVLEMILDKRIQHSRNQTSCRESRTVIEPNYSSKIMLIWPIQTLDQALRRTPQRHLLL